MSKSYHNQNGFRSTFKFLVLAGIFLLGTSSGILAQDYALNFSGSSQYVDCGAGNLAITGASSRTVEAWVYAESFNDGGVWQMGLPGNNQGEFTLRTTTTDNVWVVQIWNLDFGFTVPNSKNNWVHFAMTYDGTTIKIYANGELAGSAARTLNTLSANFYIGRWGDNWFDGMIDEVMVYNYARSEAEIWKDWSGQDDNEGSNRVGYYKMSDGSGTSLSNDAFYHNYENIGTLVGGPTWVTGVFESYPVGAGTSGDQYQIGSMRDLYWLSQADTEWDKYYLQTEDINAITTNAWAFESVGRYNTAFTGSYAGNGHTISNLKTNRDYMSATAQYIGLFTRLSGATITDLALINCHMEGYSEVGGLAGYVTGSTITNCSTSGYVKCSSGRAGGLIGYANGSTITGSSSSCTVEGWNGESGGLIGKNENTNVSNCSATGSITGSYYSNGGFVGINTGSSQVSESFSTGAVNGSSNNVGGFVGYNGANITECYNTGNATGGGIGTGGFAGTNAGSISNSYSRGTTDGDNQTGGFIGSNHSGATVTNCYAAGALTGSSYNRGGFIGSNSSSVTASFWDTETSGESTSDGGTGKTTAEMKIRTTYTDAGWDFKDAGTNDIWNIANSRNDGYPYHDWQYPSDPVIAYATLTTTAVSDISTTTASSGGNITANGGDAITARGICWSTSQNPTIANSHTSDGSGTGSYVSGLTNLTSSTTYFVRAYALNQAGYAYGDQQSFTTWDALPVFSVTPTSHDFGTLLIGELAQQTFTVSNTGGGYLYITAVTPPDGEYSVSPTSATIAGSENQTFTLTFTPSTAGAHNGNLAFTDNTGNHTVAITGSGAFSAQADAVNALTFTGTNDQYILVHDAVDPTAYTVEMWVKPASAAQQYLFVRTLAATPESYKSHMMGISADGKFEHYTWDGNPHTVTGTTTVQAGTWYHVAITAENAGVMRLFVNGIEEGVAQSIGTLWTDGDCYQIGADGALFVEYGGQIDEVRLWNVARSQAEITGAYGSLAGNESGLVGYWRLDEGSGTITGDGSGNGKTGTLMNSPTWGTSDAPVESPVFSAAPSSHDFGSLLIGRSAQQTFTVSNTGGGFLNISSVTPPDGEYSVTPSSANIPAGGSQIFTLTFTPVTAGTHNGNLAFTDNDGNHTIGITGSGVFTAQTDAGNMLTLNGASQYLDADIVTTATDNVTMEAWVYWEGQSGNAGILYQGHSASSGYGIYVLDGSGLTILVGSVRNMETGIQLPTNGWHHIAAVRESGSWMFYLDGIAHTPSYNYETPHPPSGKFNIGSLTDGTNPLNGKIDEVRVWNVARSQTQIRTSYSSLAGNETGLAAYWRLDEGSGTTSGDGSGHGNTATMYNSSTWGTSTAPVTTPGFSASPSTYDFGSVLVGTNVNQAITVTNTGGGVLHISSIASPGSDFTVSPTSADILSGGNQVFTVTFTPTSTAAQSGNFTFTDNIGNHTVGVSGAGIYQAQADAGSGISFDGTDDYIQTTLDAQPTAMATSTWEAWFKPVQLNYSEYQAIVSTDDGGWDRGIWIAPNSSQLIIGYGTNGWIPGVTLTTDTWHHIAVVFKPDNVLFYFNGEQFSLGAAPVEQGTTQNLRIGATVAGQYFQGEIDEVRVWNDQRTQTEIQTHYGSLAGNEDGLVAYWRFDEGSGATTGDGSGNSYTGTLINSPTWVGSSGAPVATPVFSASPSSHDFGSVLVGKNVNQGITVTNTGGGVLHISSITSPGSDFVVSPTTADILAGGNQVFTITFTPTSTAAQSGNFTVADNISNHTVGVSGTGVFQAQTDAGSGITFDGTDDYITIPYDANLNPSIFSVEFWAKVATGSSGFRCPVSSRHWDGSDGFYGYNFYYNTDDQWEFWIGSGKPGTWTGVTYDVDTYDEWVHVAGVYDGTTVKLYINGELKNTETSAFVPNSIAPLTIGTVSGVEGYFDGELDEIRLWNTARTEEQIQASYGSLAGNEEGLAAYWRLDEGSGSTTRDGTGNSYTGTLINSPTWVGTSGAGVSDPVYQTNASSLDLGNVAVNATSDQTVTITNSGGGFLNILSAATDNTHFTVIPSSANIAADSSQVFNVTFAPITHGTETGSLTLTHNPNGATNTISLTGTGQQAVFSASTSGLDFGNVQVNASSNLTVTVTNTGNITLSITDITCNPTEYTISPTTAEITAGANQVFTVTLAPTSTGSKPGTITFTDNALDSPQALTVSGTGVELYGSGTAGDPYQITNLNDLRFLSEHSSYWADGLFFIQTADIEASATSTWNSGAGFSPIGSTAFQGTYDGEGYTIDGLVINRSDTDFQGLFGYTMGSVIKNLGVTNINVKGRQHTGGLVGQNTSSSTIENCFTTGSVTGYNQSVGGLAGTNSNSSTITKCYSTVTCNVSGQHTYSLGGLVGYNNSATISNSYATGSVTGINAVGGLVGNGTSGTVTNCFSTGAISGSGSYIGGLIGGFSYLVNNSFWDMETSGQTISAGAEAGKTTAEMQARATFTTANWDFRGETTNGTNDIWNMGNSRNSGYPYLDWQYPSDPVIDLATITTTAISGITTSSASTGGTVFDNESGAEVTVRGICWGITDNPTISTSDTTIEGSDVGTFISSLTGLTPLTTYHVRAYGMNLAGTAYGSDVSFTTLGTPTVTTQAVSDIASTTATGNGNITVLGEPNPEHHGFAYSTTPDPGAANSTTQWSEAKPTSRVSSLRAKSAPAPTLTGGAASTLTNSEGNTTDEGAANSTGPFTSNITGLTPNTTYYVKAYATNSVGTVYGEEVTFTTSPALPTVTTQAVTEITATTATGNGNITVLGIPNSTQHGICWNTTGTPTTADSKTEAGAVSATGAFTGAMTGLTSNVTYYVRAYATNTAGTAYGEQVAFTTLPTLATITTQAVSDITATTATGNGNITDLGVPNPSQHGVCWSTSGTPTISDSKTEGGTASVAGAFTSSITGLTSNVTYYVRAYATNTAGTAYGDQVEFTTLPTLATVTTQAVTAILPTSATGNGNITSLGVPNPTQYGVCWNTESEPTVDDSKTEEGEAIAPGAFTTDITGLSGLTTYYVRAYATNTAGTSYGNEVSFSTSADEPATQASNIVFSEPDKGTFTIGWTNGDGTKRVVFMKEASSGSAEPADNSTYTANTAFGSGTQIGTTGWYCVYNGTGTTVDITNLTQLSTYRAMVCEYNGTGGGENYLTTAASNNPANYLLPYFNQLTAIGLPGLRNVDLDWGDYDNDGDLDLILIGENGGYVTKVFRNNGDNSFTEQTELSLTGFTWDGSVEWGDYNNDGYLDILVTGYTSSGFKTIIYRNNGDNSFTALSGLTLPGVGNSDARWADYDADGDLDFLVTGASSGTKIAKIYRNEGSDSFIEQTSIALTGIEYSSIAWCDYDLDGYQDILMAGTIGTDNYVTKIYHNNGNNSFSEETEFNLPGVQQGAVAWGDYNNDSYPDILITGRTADNYYGIAKVYKNNSGVGFTEQTGIVLEGVIYSSAAWGDFDGDGNLDIVITGSEYYNNYRTKIYRNNGDNTFTSQTDIVLAGTQSGTTAWVDFDNDQDLDLLICGSYYSSGYHFTSALYENIGAPPNTAPVAPTNLQVILGTGVDFTWDKASDTETVQDGLTYNLFVGTSAATSDILSPMSNISDGFRRIVAAGNSGGGNSAIIQNLPGGTYHWGVQTIDHNYCGSAFASGTSFTIAEQSKDLVFSNIQATAFDLSWTSGEMANRVVFIKETSSGLPSPVDHTTYTGNSVFGSGSQIGTSGWYCVYNGSGSSVSVTNLTATSTYRVMVLEYSGSAGSEVYLLSTANDNPSTQTMPYFIELATLTESIGYAQINSSNWGDYNNDGYLDILVSHDDTTTIFTNDEGSGLTKLTGTPFLVAYRAMSSWVDYDNDGWLDVMAVGYRYVGYFDYFCRMYKNNGNGTFTEVTETGLVGLVEGSTAWGDYNNDGLPDLLICGISSSSSSSTQTLLFRNNGDGTFTEQTDAPFIDVYRSTADWGDYDNDGDLDLFIAGYGYVPAWNSWGSQSAMYRNNGDNTFTAITSPSSIGFSYGSASWGDYDSDGWLDLLLIKSNGSVIYRNNGNSTFTEQTGITLMALDRSSADWGDYDNDGDLDILASGRNSGAYCTKMYQNKGDNSFADQINISLEGISDGEVNWGDVNNDGKLDLLFAGYDGSKVLSKVYTNNCLTSNTAPSAPTNVQVTAGDDITISWDKATDTETSQNGLTYNIFIGTSAETGDMVAPAADIGSGLRRVSDMGNMQLYNSYTISGLSTGTYYWGVQTIDNAFAGSPFATGSFTYLSAPATQATNLQFNDIQKNQMTVNWTNGNGDRRAVFARQGGGATPVPEGDVSYTASTAFGSGQQIGTTGWYCIYTGTGNTVTLTNILHTTDYQVAVMENNFEGSTVRYLTTVSPENLRTRLALLGGAGNALAFDGADDHVAIPSALAESISGGAAITIEYWFKGTQLQSPIRIQSAGGYIVAGWGTEAPAYIISTDGGTLEGLSAGTESTIENGAWHHLAMTWQRNTTNGFNTYLDGMLVASRNSADVNLPTFSGVITYLGAYNGNAELMTGQLDEVRIWNVARTGIQISENMCRALNPDNETNLVAYYKFDHILGSTSLADMKNGSSGTLTSMDVNTAWVRSGIPFGTNALVLQSTTPTPIGTTGQSCSVTITSTPDASNFLNLYHDAIGFGPVSTADVGVWPLGVVKRADIIWGIHAMGAVTADLIFDYSLVGGISNPGQIHLLKRTDQCSEWVDVSGDFVHDAGNRTFTKTGNTSFSEFSIGTEEGDNSLPVELATFSAKYRKGKVMLRWITESEMDNQGFIIERRQSKEDDWKKIVSFQDENSLRGQGSTPERTEYGYDDGKVTFGNTYYYRLLDVDFNGVCNVNKEVKVELSQYSENVIPDEFGLLPAYPNPFNPKTTIIYQLPQAEHVTMIAYDMSGRIVETLMTNEAKEPGIYTLNWEPRTLASGVYIIRIRAGKFVSTQKCMILK